MGISISGSNAISGLGGNDTDFDKVLSQLKKIEQTQLNRLVAWKSDWKLRYDGFSTIIDQVKAASSMLSQLSDKNNFVTKLVQSSNDNIITAVANASAQDVQHSIKVSQVASNAIWANTGHKFASKTDVINDTGKEQTFNYVYGGKEYNFKVPANTSLESFASMINNSATNPGIKVSLIQTGQGYMFQVAGKDTGEANDLLILDSNLVGMKATGTTSTWQTNATLNLGDKVTDPTSYIFDVTLRNGTKKSITVEGNKTAEELTAQLNNEAALEASFDSNGNLTIKNALSFTRRKADEAPYVAASTSLTLSGEFKSGNTDVKLNEAEGIAAGFNDNDKITVTLTMDDNTTRTIEINAGATKRDMFQALARISTGSSTGELNLNQDAKGTTIKLDGVKDIAFTTTDPAKTIHADKMDKTTTAASGVAAKLGGQVTSATTNITFNKDKLTERVDGATDSSAGTPLVFTVLLNDGTSLNIEGTGTINSSSTNQELMDFLAGALKGSNISVTKKPGDTGNILEVKGIKSINVTQGSVSGKGFSSEVTDIEMKIPATTGGTNPADDLFYKTDDGKFILEKAPDLVYTVRTNDGKTGVLTLPSGTSMKDVLKALQDPSLTVQPPAFIRWTWKDSDGNTVAAPATDAWKKSFQDANGKTLDLNSATGSIALYVKDIQSISGPGITGQISASSNWSIQRAANARYTVDNWPVEMESATNKVSDVIEGVVFTIQEKGDARISVSTDITSVEKSIQNFLDAINSVLVTINDLMKYDEDKEVTSNDPNDIGKDNYSPSGLTNQKGGLLQGNYGVQLFKSRFSSLVTASPPGFKARESATDLLSGDILASLANLGIKTDTDATSDTYGLLVMAPSSSIAEIQKLDKENYNDLITNHLEAVVDFFCASGSGSSTSTDFRYGSHVEGITKAGNYEVKYTVEKDGTISNVTVGGEPATRDVSQPGNYFSVATGDPKGLSILIDDLTVGDHPPAGGSSMFVRIRQGLVQTTNNFLKSELVFNDVNISEYSTPDQVADAIALKSKNGALMSLRDNYKTVMSSIDVKIEREQRRIDTWESRQKKIFANLETLLKKYAEQQTSLEGQLKQLSSS